MVYLRRPKDFEDGRVKECNFLFLQRCESTAGNVGLSRYVVEGSSDAGARRREGERGGRQSDESE